MRYTKIPETAFQNIQLNAGILVDSFTPATGAIGNLLGATSGGVQFGDSPEFSDFGEDIDNCPKNMKELKKLVAHAVTMSGTFVTIDATTAALLAGAADIDSDDSSHIIPRNDLLDSDFKDIWWVGDYSDANTGESAGFVAIHLINALNTGGFQIQSADKNKGQFAFSFEGHYSMDAQDEVPYEIYVQEGSAEPPLAPYIVLDRDTATISEGESITLIATKYPRDAVITWESTHQNIANVLDGRVTGVAAGTATVTATIYDAAEVPYSDSCVVTVTGP